MSGRVLADHPENDPKARFVEIYVFEKHGAWILSHSLIMNPERLCKVCAKKAIVELLTDHELYDEDQVYVCIDPAHRLAEPVLLLSTTPE